LPVRQLTGSIARLADIVVSKSLAETVNSLLSNQIGSCPKWASIAAVDNIT
jgi:hypothetical protein